MIRAAMLSAIFATPGFAAVCTDHDALSERLAVTYSEARIGMGIDVEGRLMEVYISPTGTWTMTVTLPSGMSCMVASGESWQVTTDHLPPNG